MRSMRWKYLAADRGNASELSAALGVTPITASLLINRGIRGVEEARAFLRPDLKGLIAPQRLPDMGVAVERIKQALRGGEKLGIFGDYDVDGTTGTAILVRFFRLLGREVETYIPHRVNEGYGLSSAAIDDLAARGVKLLFTVDCGTANFDEIAHARERGMEVIVLDHHEPQEPRPAATALINPKMPGAEYPFLGLCSAGLSFKLVWALSEGLHVSSTHGAAYQEFIFDALGYVALGTIADVSPLVGENRVFVTYGLEALARTRSKGLRALLERARLKDRRVTSTDVAFRLAPRLNAVGRLGKASETLELLTSDDDARVAEIADRVEGYNEERRGVEVDISKQAFERVRDEVDLNRDRVIVVADERWHLGVVGIVAARLVDAFHRPAFVLAIEGDIARGSARSVEGFALHLALEACTDVLRTHGGHAMAAGLSVQKDRIGEFRKRVNAYAVDHLNEEDLHPSLTLDGEVRIDDLSEAAVREIAMLAPYGCGNPAPLFSALGTRVAGHPKLMGKKSDHVSFHVAHQGASIRAVGFGMGELYEDLRSGKPCSIAFTPGISEWMGRETVELQLKDVKFDQ